MARRAATLRDRYGERIPQADAYLRPIVLSRRLPSRMARTSRSRVAIGQEGRARDGAPPMGKTAYRPVSSKQQSDRLVPQRQRASILLPNPPLGFAIVVRSASPHQL